MAKTLYHSELVRFGPAEVTLKSDILKSKYQGKPDYVVLVFGHEERNYSIEGPNCRAVWEGRKGQTFTVVAEGSGKDGSAAVTYVGSKGGETPQPTPRPPAADSRRPEPPPAPASPPEHQNAANRPPERGVEPLHGAMVGAAINKAVDFAIASSEPWDPNRIWEHASDLIRVHQKLEAGQLAKPFRERKTE